MNYQADKDHARLGAEGYCICPKCETRVRHKRGIPCQEERCPKCGSKMLREGSHHHQLWETKRKQHPKDS